MAKTIHILLASESKQPDAPKTTLYMGPLKSDAMLAVGSADPKFTNFDLGMFHFTRKVKRGERGQEPLTHIAPTAAGGVVASIPAAEAAPSPAGEGAVGGDAEDDAPRIVAPPKRGK